MVLGIIDEKGDVNIHPAWFYYNPSKEMIYVEISRSGSSRV